jgi:hypothetical protein
VPVVVSFKLPVVVVVALLTVGLLVFCGGTLLLDTWWDRWRDDGGLADRLDPYQPLSIADEAQLWLNHRR